MPHSEIPTRAGYVALIGRPNVGKSTLMNRLIGQKISITSSKPQTTRNSVTGIRTDEHCQMVFIDTPGMHSSGKRALNRYLNRTASGVLSQVNVVLFLADALFWGEEDDKALERLHDFKGSVILVVNKIDQIPNKAKLLPLMGELATKYAFAAVIPVSAMTGSQVDLLAQEITQHLPESAFLYEEDQITTASRSFLAAEIVREKLTRQLNQELPYSMTVEIEKFEIDGRLIRIHALIWVERASQKGIVIGQGGALLKEAGRQAREDMEKLFDSKVFLKTWVKVREDWSNDERALMTLGFSSE